MNVLGIDGGGSKTEFRVADEQGNIVSSVVMPEGTNPWKNGGIDKVSDVLRRGLEQLSGLESVTSCVAGISGCHTDKKAAGTNSFANKFRDTITAILPKNAKVSVNGDLFTSFRSQAPTKHGILVIGGSGSAVCLLYPDGNTYVFDSIGYGGQDIGIAIATAAQRGELSPATEVWLESIYGTSIHDLPLSEIYLHPQTVALSKLLADQTDQQIIADTTPIINLIAGRLAFKIWATRGKYGMVSGIDSEAPVDIVLSGGTWQFDALKSRVIEAVQKTNPSLVIHHDPSIRPIEGAIKLALDALHS